MLSLGKYSVGIGDRFAHQAEAQLKAFQMAAEKGADIVPVWNKSNREHITIGSEPGSVRRAADAAVQTLKWRKEYRVDADHIRLETVDRFIPHSDFFTIDVADFIGNAPSEESLQAFLQKNQHLTQPIHVAGLSSPLTIPPAQIEKIARKYLYAVQQAGVIYRHIEKAKGAGQFITEVSMDETDAPQSPPELLIILTAIAHEGIPAQTIAPKFTGRFNKGVDYVGDLKQFEKEFNDDLAVIRHCVKAHKELPPNLKLSVHSGSDKFSIYGPIRRALKANDAGVHLKTAGTTWLEEVIGLAEAGGNGLALAKEIYAEALDHVEELCTPYASVIDIDRSKLPSADAVRGWDSKQYVRALRHDPACPNFNPHLRQLLHVGYKVAAKMGDRYLNLLVECRESIARNVTGNIYERHLKPLFV
jgi:hypothetical protein